MNIITPSGKVYAKVYIKGHMLYISPSRYDYHYSMTLDAKVIPQLIAILKDLEQNNV